MTKNKRWLVALVFLIAAGSFLLGWWPVAIVGIVAMGFVGRGLFAVLLGLLFDLAYGTPLGLAAYLFFPFTLLGLGVVAVRYGARRYFLDRASRDTL